MKAIIARFELMPTIDFWRKGSSRVLGKLLLTRSRPDKCRDILRTLNNKITRFEFLFLKVIAKDILCVIFYQFNLARFKYNLIHFDPHSQYSSTPSNLEPSRSNQISNEFSLIVPVESAN